MCGILIISEQIDTSTNIVCSWLNYYDCPYLRLDDEQGKNIDIEIIVQNCDFKTILHTNEGIHVLEETKIVWFRRGYLKFGMEQTLLFEDNSTNKSIVRFIDNEGETLEKYLYEVISSERRVNYPGEYNYNKLIALKVAYSLGFNIPDTILSRKSNSLKRFVDVQGKCISKSIQDIMPVYYHGKEYSSGKINRVDAREITQEHYWYSLFQKEITKKYELRIFVFFDNIYSMDIFSQLDTESELDFRDVDVNGAHPNRMVPYQLPNDIGLRIRQLMKRLNLESGSIDMIVDDNDDYYFLEVNPVGQFNFVSEVCNYYIEKDIAFSLIQ